MALLHLIDVPALLGGIPELSEQGDPPSEDAESARSTLAGVIGRWIEATPDHPVVILVADGPTTESPPVAGLITKQVDAVEAELLRRLEHGKGGRYRVVSQHESVVAAAQAAECDHLEAAALWAEIKGVLKDPFAPEPPPPPPAVTKAPKTPAKKKAAKKKVAKKKVAKKKVAKKKVAKKVVKKKASDDLGELDKLVERALEKSPPAETRAAPSPAPAPLTTEGELNADQVAAWKQEFSGEAPDEQPKQKAKPKPGQAKPGPKPPASGLEADEVNEWLDYFKGEDSSS